METLALSWYYEEVVGTLDLSWHYSENKEEFQMAKISQKNNGNLTDLLLNSKSKDSFGGGLITNKIKEV